MEHRPSLAAVGDADWSMSGKLLQVVGWPAFGSSLLLSNRSTSSCVLFGSFKVYSCSSDTEILHFIYAFQERECITEWGMSSACWRMQTPPSAIFIGLVWLPERLVLKCNTQMAAKFWEFSHRKWPSPDNRDLHKAGRESLSQCTTLISVQFVSPLQLFWLPHVPEL